MSRSVLVLALVLAAPLALADTERGVTVGVDWGPGTVGVWDLYWWNVTSAATRSLDLTWETSLWPIPWADYDLRLYRPGSLADNRLANDELVAASASHPGAHHAEHITHALPTAGLYVVAVVPWQTQGEVYTLASDAGDLAFAAEAPGVIIGN